MDVALEKIEAFAAACRKAAAQGLMRCSSGNMSCRADEQLMLVKASRSWMEEATAEDVAVCRIADGVSVNHKKPSVEIGFHAGVLRARPDVNVVLHFQSPAATVLGCCGPERHNYFVVSEIPYYVGPVGIVPYIMPGTPKLAEAVVDAMKKHDVAILCNHGQVTVGKDFDEAIQRAVFFEMACNILVHGGGAVRPLSPEAVCELRAAKGV